MVDPGRVVCRDLVSTAERLIISTFCQYVWKQFNECCFVSQTDGGRVSSSHSSLSFASLDGCILVLHSTALTTCYFWGSRLHSLGLPNFCPRIDNVQRESYECSASGSSLSSLFSLSRFQKQYGAEHKQSGLTNTHAYRAVVSGEHPKQQKTARKQSGS